VTQNQQKIGKSTPLLYTCYYHFKQWFAVLKRHVSQKKSAFGCNTKSAEQKFFSLPTIRHIVLAIN